MVDLDQAMRHKNLKDEEYWEEKVDRHNTAHLKRIVADIGWPTVSKVGKRASSGAWLIAQHVDNVDRVFQRKCLWMMRACDAREVRLDDVAYLEDRVRLNNGQKQLYGTQFIQVDGKHVLRPIHDRAHVDRRRKAMGLGTLRQGIAMMYRKYPMKKG